MLESTLHSLGNRRNGANCFPCRQCFQTSSSHHDPQTSPSRSSARSDQILQKDRQGESFEQLVRLSCWFWPSLSSMRIVASFEADTKRHEVLRERYVREDIPCGYEDCVHCDEFPGYRPVLPRIGFTQHMKSSGKEGHFVVLDTNIVLHQASQFGGESIGFPFTTMPSDTSLTQVNRWTFSPRFLRLSRSSSLRPPYVKHVIVLYRYTIAYNSSSRMKIVVSGYGGTRSGERQLQYAKMQMG